MDQAEHGKRLAAAMAAKQVDRQTVATAVNRGVRTITGWTSGEHMPSETQRVILRRLLGAYDTPGDAVEAAIANSELADWRQDAVRSVYRRNLDEQRRDGVADRGAS
jgi:acyl-CoA synthetase (NDP forming)